MKKDHALDMAGKPLDENDLLLDHAYDGIQELDNDLPPWWIKMFYLCIAFSGVYMFMYHIVDMWNLPMAEYIEELKAAGEYEEATPANGAEKGEAAVAVAPELSPEEMLAQNIKKGRKIFAMNCSACHAADGGGSVGPNLCDEYWLHGGSKEAIKHIIVEGVPAKGMISWKAMLRADQIDQVTDYVISLKGTSPAVAKAPQGQKE
jgi:cytochrome c oxidase cbb3-type subunit 3